MECVDGVLHIRFVCDDVRRVSHVIAPLRRRVPAMCRQYPAVPILAANVMYVSV